MRRSVTESLLLVTMLYFVMPNARGKPRRKERSEWRAPTRYGLASA